MKVHTVEEVAEMLRVEKQTIYRLIKSGKLRAFQLGTTYRVKDKALQDFCTEIEVD